MTKEAFRLAIASFEEKTRSYSTSRWLSFRISVDL